MTDRDEIPLTQYSRCVWEPRAGRKLNDEDLREIHRNVFGFLQVLRDWEREERHYETADPTQTNQAIHAKETTNGKE